MAATELGRHWRDRRHWRLHDDIAWRGLDVCQWRLAAAEFRRHGWHWRDRRHWRLHDDLAGLRLDLRKRRLVAAWRRRYGRGWRIP
jgi:hypothetical protein